MHCSLFNRSPARSLAGMMPYEAWTGMKPTVSFLRTFGCIPYAN